MNINAQLNDDVILESLGERIAAIRLSLNLTQEELAEEAGLGVRTLQRLESGESATRLSGFLRVCRVLGLLENLDTFVPEPPQSPMELLKYRGHQRQRATGSRVAEKPEKEWTWGDGE